MHKFAPRIAAYGERVLVANNLLAISQGRNFKYLQTTRRTFPAGKGNCMGFDPPRESIILFDYNKRLGIGINKGRLGLTKPSLTGKASDRYFCQGVVVVDNYVYNNGHRGFDISGNWVTIAHNHNERQMLREGRDPEGTGGWELTLDGHLESSPGGNGAISDNLSRAFDLAGKNLWVHENTYNNLGSDPGNNGEGILCQAHAGSQIYSWAITYNRYTKGDGETGYIGAWDVNVVGALFGWNVLPEQSFAKKLAAKSNSISVIAKGRGGWATTSYLSQIGKVLHALPKDTAIVVIQLGSNDLRMHGHTPQCIEQTTANMGKLADPYQRTVPLAKIYIAAPPNIFPDDLTERLRKAGFGSNSPEYLKILSDSYRRLAEQKGLRFIDLYPVVSPGNTIDGAHPNAAGHAQVADAIWRVLSSNLPR